MTNKPGFYVAKVRGVEGVRGVLRGDGWFCTPESVEGYYVHAPGRYAIIRPLWTADPESDDWEALAEAYRKTKDGYTLGVDGYWRNEGGSIHQGYPRDPMGIAPLIYSHGHGCTCGGPDCPGGAS